MEVHRALSSRWPHNGVVSGELGNGTVLAEVLDGGGVDQFLGDGGLVA